MEKITKIILALFVSLLCFVPGVEINANSQFAGNEPYYLQMCSQVLETNEAVQTCKAFKEYYQDYSDSVQDEYDKLQGELDAVKGDMNKLIELINRQNDEIEALNDQIEVLEISINKMEENIEALNNDIIKREEDIKVRDAQIRERMISIQQFIGLNGYIDFIMGAKDLIDLIRRMSGIEKITGYDKEQIELLQADIEELNEDKAEVERQKVEIEDRQNTIIAQRSNIEALQSINNQALATYETQEADYLAKMREQSAILGQIQGNMPNINTSKPGDIPDVGDNATVAFPVAGSYWKSAGTWAYPSGGMHQGVDYAAPVGTPLVAPADGIVLYANNPCPTYSFGLGDWCGYPSGGGNTVLMAMQINGTTYAISYSHLARENFVVKGKSTVARGEVIGGMGTSGNSTGPHVHIEVINLGTKPLHQVAMDFAGSGDFVFGTGWRGGRRCENGYSSPCKMRPEHIFGV